MGSGDSRNQNARVKRKFSHPKVQINTDFCLAFLPLRVWILQCVNRRRRGRPTGFSRLWWRWQKEDSPACLRRCWDLQVDLPPIVRRCVRVFCLPNRVYQNNTSECSHDLCRRKIYLQSYNEKEAQGLRGTPAKTLRGLFYIVPLRFFYPHLSIWLSGFSLLKLVIPKQPSFFFKCIFKTSTKPPRKARVVSCSQTCKQFERVLINPVWFLTYWYYITLISSSLQVGDTDSSDADPRAHWQTICGSHWKRSFTTMTPIKMREPPLQGTFATEMRTIPSRALKKKGPH